MYCLFNNLFFIRINFFTSLLINLYLLMELKKNVVLVLKINRLINLFIFIILINKIILFNKVVI